ncbi:MAG: type IV secretion system protein [Coriobacteriaceae bacterium]|nr:type IV secretion system protein [Coriobacteriaceae bacterium]MCI6845479.1 type IV secretion system protein [Coriobacteriaceae bacterium]
MRRGRELSTRTARIMLALLMAALVALTLSPLAGLAATNQGMATHSDPTQTQGTGTGGSTDTSGQGSGTATHSDPTQGTGTDGTTTTDSGSGMATHPDATSPTGQSGGEAPTSNDTSSFDAVADFILNTIFKPILDAAIGVEAGVLSGCCTLVTKDLPSLAKSIPTDSSQSFTAVASQSGIGSGIPMGGIIGFVKTCYDGIRPLGATFLAVLFGLQALRVVREGEQGPGQVPYVERFGWLFLRFGIVKVFFDRSMDVTVGVFNAFSSVSAAVAGNDDLTDYYDMIKNAMSSSMANEATLGMLFLLVILVGLVLLLLSAVLSVMMYVATYARWLELFVMLPFAPLAFATLASDETRHFFWGYLRTIVGCAMAFLITIIIARSFPVVLASTLSSPDLVSGPLAGLGGVIGLAGVMFLYIFALAKSGSWAQAVLGG